MAIVETGKSLIRGITSSVPESFFDNEKETTAFDPEEVEKVVKMAGVRTRHLAGEKVCSSDLCYAAAKDLMDGLEWVPASVDALIMVTQTPDYFLPSTSCVIHKWLGLSDKCAAFDVGLGCSGYPYALWLASMMLERGAMRRVLILHGETPTRFAHGSDRAVALLFGDAGSATALEATGEEMNNGEGKWWFSLHTDGSGCRDLIIEGGGFRERFPEDPKKHYVSMNGANVFNFTIKRVPRLIEDTLMAAEMGKEDVDYFIFHQSNQFIMRHLAKKAGLPEEKVPMTIQCYGSAGGPSIPLTITCGGLKRPDDRALKLLLLGYGVGLSWGSALIDLPPDARLSHLVYKGD